MRSGGYQAKGGKEQLSGERGCEPALVGELRVIVKGGAGADCCLNQVGELRVIVKGGAGADCCLNRPAS